MVEQCNRVAQPIKQTNWVHDNTIILSKQTKQQIMLCHFLF